MCKFSDHGNDLAQRKNIGREYYMIDLSHLDQFRQILCAANGFGVSKLFVSESDK